MVQLTLLLAMVVNCNTILQETCKNISISFWCQARLKGHLKALKIEKNIESTHTYSILSMSKRSLEGLKDRRKYQINTHIFNFVHVQSFEELSSLLAQIQFI